MLFGHSCCLLLAEALGCTRKPLGSRMVVHVRSWLFGNQLSTWAQKCAFEIARQGLHGDAIVGAPAHSNDESGPCKQTGAIMARLPPALYLASEESPKCLWSARVRWKSRNETFTAACTFLLRLTAALSAHHGCRIMLLRASASSILPCSGSASGRILARNGALDASLQGLDSGVCCVDASQE